jgi:uncharacterized protein
MALNCERPLARALRPFALAATLSVLAFATACSLVKPAGTTAPASNLEHAQRLATEGKHTDAAQLYADLAVQSPDQHDNYELLSAEQWVLGGNVPAAKQAFAAVSPAARTAMPVSRALVAAEIALADRQGAEALRELDSITPPTATDLAQSYFWLRGKAQFLLGHPAEGVRSFVDRERYIADPNALKASRQELFGLVRDAALHGQPMKPAPKSDPVVGGWLALGPVAVEVARNPMHAGAALEGWRKAYPQHPAADSVVMLAQSQIAVATGFPDQIALLLPLSGRAESVGVAVRDGFIAAYLEQDPANRPHLRIYDVAAETVAGAYRHAIEDGAGFVVGPLTKEDVAAVVPLNAGKTPELALNFLADNVNASHDFYQFALLPEDEARIVARRLIADNKLRGVALIAQGEIGTRVQKAFADELAQHGGTLVDGARYDATRADFSDIIKQVLQVHGVKGEPSTHRGDVDFVFLEGPSGASRLILPSLKFNYAGDIPVYSTSDSFDPGSSANADLEGLTFPDMPWLVSADPVTAQIRDGVRAAWPSRTARLSRLYAFGFDAYRLVPALKSGSMSQTQDIAGVTGKLYLDEHNRIRRDLDWVQIRNGVPVPL